MTVFQLLLAAIRLLGNWIFSFFLFFVILKLNSLYKPQMGKLKAPNRANSWITLMKAVIVYNFPSSYQTSKIREPPRTLMMMFESKRLRRGRLRSLKERQKGDGDVYNEYYVVQTDSHFYDCSSDDYVSE